jgi:thiamine biosynthesis lipoprotein
MTATHAFRSMGTRIEMLGPGGDPRFDDAIRRVQERFAIEDRRFSRFRADSELTSVNTAGGGVRMPVTRAFAEVVGLALDAAARSAGLFDPTVYDALVAAGYDCTFDEVLAGARVQLHPAEPCARWREVQIGEGSVTLPADLHLDLGGLAKGWTVDRAAEDALATGLPWVLVNAGGDLLLAGEAPSVDVRVEDPFDADAELMRLRLDTGALATSSVSKRAWGPGLHHLIDPRSGAPARSGVLQATTWAPSCAEAEIRSTWTLVQGRSAVRRFPSVLVTEDEVLVTLPVEAVAA